MTTTLTNILLNPGVVAASHSKAVINDKTANDQDFMTLLNQSLPGGLGLDEGQLLQLLPEQTAGRDLSPAGQLLVLSDSQSVALSDDPLMELTQLLSQFRQVINQEHAGHLSATGGKNSAVQSENGQTKPLSAEETEALNALLVMLSQQQVHSHSLALSVLNTGNPLADTSQQKVQFTDPVLSISGALNGEMVNGLMNASASRIIDAKTSGGDKYDRNPVLNSVTERHKTSGLKPADLTESANNVVLPIAASTRATEVDIAIRDPAVFAAHNMSIGIAHESHTATGNVSMPPAGSHGALIQAQLGSPQWQQAISQQIMLFSRNGQHNAELRLHPAELGSVKISLKLDDNLASLQMISPHSHVRAALEAALPMLRTQLAESGIQLGQSNISSESFTGQQQGQQQSPPSPGRNFITGSGDDSLVVPASLVSLARSDGAIDTFV